VYLYEHDSSYVLHMSVQGTLRVLSEI